MASEIPKGESMERGISMLGFFALLLKRGRLILLCAFLGTAAGLALAFLMPVSYTTRMVFQPQSGEDSSTGLALVASQFGFAAPRSGGEWGPAMYMELLRTRTILETVAIMPLKGPVGDAEVQLPDLLGFGDLGEQERLSKTVDELKNMIRPRELVDLASVEVSVSSRWPGISFQLANHLVEALQGFHQQTRRSQARVERVFIEEQVGKSAAALASAEEKLLGFIQNNRSYSESPDLRFEYDRLSRELTLRQQVYTSMVTKLEEARIKEVHDTPVITIIENPQLPLNPSSRGVLTKPVLGLIVGLLLGALLSFLVFCFRWIQHSPHVEAVEFRQGLQSVWPGRSPR